MRILVYGAGALGCELAHCLLQNKKNNVTLLARGEWRERIDQKGLVIRHYVQHRTTVDRVRTVGALAPDDCYDLVFVVVQASQLPAALPELRANRSQYFVFVGNNPHARSTLAAMKRPTDKIAFGFWQSAGGRERDRVVSVHAGLSMTVGGASMPLASAFRQRLASAFYTTGCRLTLYRDMDEWLKCHLAVILPICYVCYAVHGELNKATKAQRTAILDAALEACQMLKDAGVPVNDAEATDYCRPGTKGRRQMEAVMLGMCKTKTGALCSSRHAMRAVGEIRLLDEEFAKIRAATQTPMPTWDALRAAMPAWDTLQSEG